MRASATQVTVWVSSAMQRGAVPGHLPEPAGNQVTGQCTWFYMSSRSSGGLDVKIPRSVAYPDWHKKATKRNLGAAQLHGSFRQKTTLQEISRKWQDGYDGKRKGSTE